jgi:hypothetical protein
MNIAIMNGLGCPNCGGTCGNKKSAVMNNGSVMGLFGVGNTSIVSNADLISYQAGINARRERKPFGFGAVSDYDIIKIGGNNYSANQIIDKTVTAKNATKVYSNTSGKGTVIRTVQAGQPIGRVYSYLKPTDSATDGRGWLMFDIYSGKFGYVPDESVNTTDLKDQGVKTVSQEVKEEADQKMKDDSPTEYYLKKDGTKAVFIGGGIILAAVLGKEAIRALITKKATPAT